MGTLMTALKKAQDRRRYWLTKLNGTPEMKKKYDYWNLHCTRLCLA